MGIRLIVGLGNPGKDYADTRHNAGFCWVEALASRAHAALRAEAKFHGIAGRAKINGGDVWLLEPQTFMNASGRAVSALASFYRITPEEILVVHDELDVPPGEARLKQGGGNAGHNGLKDIQSALKTPDFWRLRLGVGRPLDRADMVNYVLHSPSRAEREALDQAIEGSLVLLPLLVAGDFGAAMMKLHTKPKPAPAEKLQ
jgi:PTH1 family peptidyl-tRNA hydrolase